MSNAYKVAFKSVQFFASQLKKNEKVDESFESLVKLGMSLEIYRSFEIETLAERYIRHPAHASSARMMLNKIRELKQKKYDFEIKMANAALASKRAALLKGQNRKRHCQPSEQHNSKAMRIESSSNNGSSTGEQKQIETTKEQKPTVPIPGQVLQNKPTPLSANQSIGTKKQHSESNQIKLATREKKCAEDAKLDAVRTKLFRKMEQYNKEQRKTMCIPALPISPS